MEGVTALPKAKVSLVKTIPERPATVLRIRYGNRAIFQKLIKRMRRVDESWERQTAPRVYIY
eukprot:COSAG01_NODE_74919_length_199_cov_138.380000_1_plen_61_part_01